MHCSTMQCLAPLLWPDVLEVTWPALQLHALQPHSTLCLSWYFPLAIWQTVQLPLRHTQRWGWRGCWAIGGFLHPSLSLCSIWDMWLGLSTAYRHHCCLVVYTNHLLRTDPHRNLIRNRDIANASEVDVNVPWFWPDRRTRLQLRRLFIIAIISDVY